MRIIYYTTCCMIVTALNGCMIADNHEGCRVAVDVRGSRDGARLPEWVLVSQVISNVGWNTNRSDRTIEETVLLVAAQRPGDSVYEVQAYSDGGILFMPPIGYGGRKSTCAWVFARGYEPTARVCHRETTKAGAGDARAPMPTFRETYLLRPWNNRPEHVGARTTLSLLSDTKNFEPYEALRGTSQGAGVPRLYEYYIRRFEAIRAENPDMPIAPAVAETVAWLRAEVGGARPKPLLASPTTTTRRGWVPQPLTENETAARFHSLGENRAVHITVIDSQSRETVDKWVCEAALVAMRRSEPHPQVERLLALDYETRAEAACHIAAFKASKDNDADVLCRFRRITVYAKGYEPSAEPAEDFRPETLPHFTYRLLRWNNADPASVAAFTGLLEDDKRFDLYRKAEAEAFSGVIPLYRYVVARYEALRPEQRDSLPPKAKRRVDGLRAHLAQGGS
jgi:hypothetical protein